MHKHNSANLELVLGKRSLERLVGGYGLELYGHRDRRGQTEMGAKRADRESSRAPTSSHFGAWPSPPLAMRVRASHVLL